MKTGMVIPIINMPIEYTCVKSIFGIPRFADLNGRFGNNCK